MNQTLSVDTPSETAPARWGLGHLLGGLAGLSLLIGLALVYAPPFDPIPLIYFGPGVLMTVAALLVPRRWVRITAASLVTLPAFLVVLLFGEVIWLFSPFEAPLPNLLGTVAFAVALLLGAPALALAIRPGLARHEPRFRQHVVVVLALALGGAGAYAAAHSDAPTSGGFYDVAPDARVELAVVDGNFAPSALTITAGVLTEIVLINDETALHTFRYTHGGTEHEVVLAPQSTASFLVKFAEPGEFVIGCSPHPEMSATLRVVAA